MSIKNLKEEINAKEKENRKIRSKINKIQQKITKENLEKNVITKTINPKVSRYLIFSMVLIFSVLSCRKGNFYFEEVARIENSWKAEDIKTFKIPVKNKEQKFTMYFILRNNNDYAFSNIYFFTKLKSPAGEIIVDTLEYQVAYPDGEWMGFGMGNIKQNTLVYKENIALKDTGIYQIEVGQAMRENDLVGIEDISLMIEKN